MYQFIEKLHTLYGLLQDEQSKEIFQARFAIDMEPSILNYQRLVSVGSFKDHMFLELPQSLENVLKKLNREQKKIILYGTAKTGKLFAERLQLEHIDFFGFCGRQAERYPDGILGKPVLSPDELVAHGNEYYVVRTAALPTSYRQISEFLREHNYPEDHILDKGQIRSHENHDKRQYFEFPELYRRGTAFVDGGCFDCGSSYKFAEWCEGAYSSIIAFEPDPNNYAKCHKKAQDDPLPNFQLVNAGLSSQKGMAPFDAENMGASRIKFAECDSNKADTNIAENTFSIPTVALDDIVGNRTVGFIKMDIEGAEFDALHGAKNTILRDKPLLAICVYHLRGDVFAIIDYLHQLLPEYRFMLRHYSTTEFETVLYASVDL